MRDIVVKIGEIIVLNKQLNVLFDFCHQLKIPIALQMNVFDKNGERLLRPPIQSKNDVKMRSPCDSHTCTSLYR